MRQGADAQPDVTKNLDCLHALPEFAGLALHNRTEGSATKLLLALACNAQPQQDCKIPFLLALPEDTKPHVNSTSVI